MKRILLPALAGFTMLGLASAAQASDSVRAMKGHLPIPEKARGEAARGVSAACHPDPGKGRICRHVAIKAEEARQNATALAQAELPAPQASAQ